MKSFITVEIWIWRKSLVYNHTIYNSHFLDAIVMMGRDDVTRPMETLLTVAAAIHKLVNANVDSHFRTSIYLLLIIFKHINVQLFIYSVSIP